MMLTRRKLLISAAACATGASRALAGDGVLTWSGVALGADAELRFAGIERDRAQSLLQLVLEEVERLENIFSLYRPQSELSRLNAEGRLPQPSQDMRLLLDASLRYWKDTGGAFDPAVQPLWLFLSRHFASTQEAPGREALRQVLGLCDPGRIAVGSAGIALAPGMALTFNGIAQGYITDRAAEILIAHGLRNVLINLGEHRALPGHPWPVVAAGSGRQFALHDRAIAQSAGRGTPLSADGRWHHLIDPQNGESANFLRSVTVVARTATEADALSTALFVSPLEKREAIVRRFKPAAVMMEDKQA